MQIKRRNGKLQGKIMKGMAILMGCTLIIGSTYAWNELTLHKTNLFKRNNAYTPVVVLNDSFDPPNNWEISPDNAAYPEQEKWVDKRVSVTHQSSGGSPDVFVRLSLKEFMQTQSTPGQFITRIDESTGDDTGEKLLFATFAEPGDRMGQFVEEADRVNLPTGHPWKTLEPYPVEIGQDAQGNPITKIYLLTDTTHTINGIYGAPMLRPGELLGLWGTAKRANIEHALQKTDECDYNPYLWDDVGIKPKAGSAKKDLQSIREYIALKRPDNFITLKEWANGGDPTFGKFWIIDEKDGWVYWGDPLVPGSSTANLLEGVRLRKSPLPTDEYGSEIGSLEYTIHVDLNAIDGNWEDLLDGESAMEDVEGQARSTRHFYDDPQNHTLEDQSPEKQILLNKINDHADSKDGPIDPPPNKKQPKPTDPAEPEETESSSESTDPPAQPGPTDPGPTDPGPTDPPAQPGPTDPGPTDPPAQPGPTDPEPTDPADPPKASSSESGASSSSSSKEARDPRFIVSDPATYVPDSSSSSSSSSPSKRKSEDPPNETSESNQNPDGGVSVDGITSESDSTGNDTTDLVDSTELPEDEEFLVRQLAMTTIPVEVIWDLPSQEQSKMPEVIELKLQDGETTVQTQQVQQNTANRWETMFIAPKYDEAGDVIEYSVLQKPVKYFESEIDETQAGVKIHSKYLDDEGNPFGGVRVDNLVPNDILTIKGTVLWDHGDNKKHPDQQPVDTLVQVRTTDGEVVQTVEVSAANNWGYSVELPRYDGTGSEIPYTLTQWEVPHYAQQPEGYDILNVFEGNGITTDTSTKNPLAWLPITLMIAGFIVFGGGGAVLFFRRKQKREIKELLAETTND